MIRPELPLYLLLLTGACGVTDAGTGTRTLHAVVEIDGHPNETQIRCALKFEDEPVIGAKVRLTDVETGKTIALTGAGSNNNLGDFGYRGSFPRYARTLDFSASMEENAIAGRLEGPAPHVIVRPGNDAIVRARDLEFITVQWESDSGAERTTVSAGQITPMVMEGDPSDVEIPVMGLANGLQQVEVIRETSVELAGGKAGSVMRARYSVDNRFTIER